MALTGTRDCPTITRDSHENTFYTSRTRSIKGVTLQCALCIFPWISSCTCNVVADLIIVYLLLKEHLVLLLVNHDRTEREKTAHTVQVKAVANGGYIPPARPEVKFYP